MPLEDPFFVVRDEVNATMHQVHQLHKQWSGLLEGNSCSVDNEYNSVATELHNQLKSVEWDLEDLSQTIGVVESNPGKFHLTMDEIDARKEFVYKTKCDVKKITDQVTAAAEERRAQTRKASLSTRMDSKYSRLDREVERANQVFVEEQQEEQQVMVRLQEEQLELVGQSVHVLRAMGEEIGTELNAQNEMLHQLQDEVDHTQSRLDFTLLRLEKALHLAGDTRQMYVIGGLLIAIVLVILLFAFTL